MSSIRLPDETILKNTPIPSPIEQINRPYPPNKIKTKCTGKIQKTNKKYVK